jgi:DNA-binding NtrC family response regulator
MSDRTTTLDTASEGAARREAPPVVLALAVAWAEDEPGRAGEVVLFPASGRRRSFVLGRGDGPVGDHERARLVRQRPGETLDTPPLASPHLSRAQLVARGHPDGGLAIENVGKRALKIGGRVVVEGRVRPGDVLEIGRHLVLVCVERPLALPRLEARDPRLAFPFGAPDGFGYVGEAPACWTLRNEIVLVAARPEHVLILGESGTGKELVAQALHALGSRAKRRLVARNAATVPPGIIDAELFGNAANYPNAGMAERPGLVGEAEGSTLFLDEIGELPLEAQAHLLRLLDGGEYQRLGDPRRRTADLRVVAATNRPLEHLKADLAARFLVRLRTPAMRERPEDVMLVARHLLRGILAGHAKRERLVDGAGDARVAGDLAAALVRHPFATNVRELAAVLFSAVLESPGDAVELTPGARAMLGGAGVDGGDAGSDRAAREVSREELAAAMERHAGVREKVWRDLGLANRYVLKRLLKKHGLAGAEED